MKYLKHKLKTSFHLFESDAEDGSWAKDSDSRARHFTASCAHDSVSRPDSKDGSNSEVGVDDRRAVEGIKGHRVSLLTCIDLPVKKNKHSIFHLVPIPSAIIIVTIISSFYYLLGSHVHNFRLFFRHGCHADARVAKRIQEHLVGDQIDGKLLIAVNVDAGSASARRSSDLQRAKDKVRGI